MLVTMRKSISSEAMTGSFKMFHMYKNTITFSLTKRGYTEFSTQQETNVEICVISSFHRDVN